MLTPSSEDTKHPATDTQVDTKLQYYKASSKTSPCRVPCDLLTAQAIDFVAILGHNFENETIQFQGADNSGFSSGLVTKTLTYNATDIFEFFASMTKRYVRVNYTKGSDFTDFPQFATVVCGAYIEPNRSFIKPYEVGNDDLSDGEYTEAGVFYGQEKEILKTWRLPFKGLSDTSKDEIEALIDYQKTVKAFVVCFDSSTPNGNSYWVKLRSISPRPYQHLDYWNWNAPLVEVK
jgi:hypothetical protein